MESYIGAAPSQLISQLDFSLKSTAPYLIQRRSVRMYPSSATSFSPRGTNVCRITLASEGEWLDPSTLRFVCTVQNNSATDVLVPHSTSATCLFQRCREMIGGSVISDILYYNRTAETFQNLLEPTEWQFSEGVLGFGGSFSNQVHTIGANVNLYEADRHPQVGAIPAGGRYTCMQRLMTGLVKSDKLLPLRIAPVTYEFTLANASECFSAHYSQNYELTNCYMLMDLCTLDSGVQQSYYSSLLRGSALAINIPQYITLFFPIPQGTSATSIVVQRALTRNVAVFVTFQSATGDLNSFPNPNFVALGDGWPDPANPMLQDGTFSYQLQLGSKLFPEQPMNSQAEMYETLRKAIGTHNQDIKSCSLDRKDYYTSSFVLGVDLEKNLGDPFRAVNTRAGDIFRLNFLGIDPNCNINGCYVTLIGSAICELREAGAFLFD